MPSIYTPVTQTGFFGPADIAAVTSGEPHNTYDDPIARFCGQIGSYDEGDAADVSFVYTAPTAEAQAEIELTAEYPGGLDETDREHAEEIVGATEDAWEIIAETADTLYAAAGDPDHIVTPEEIAAALRSGE